MQSNRMENSGVKVKSSRRLTQLNLFVCLKLNLYSFSGDVIPSCVTRRLTFQDVLKLEILWGFGVTMSNTKMSKIRIVKYPECLKTKMSKEII